MNKNHKKIDLLFLLQRLVLILFGIFPVLLSIISQLFVLIHSWSFIKFVQFGFLVVIFLVPVFGILKKNSIWSILELNKYLPIIWVVSLAIILRIILVQLISTNFVSDMEDVHLFAVDIYSGNPMANIQNYPNIPGATHLNMTAFVLSFVYKLFGASTSIAKLFLVFWGGVTTLLIYLAGQEMANKRAGFLAAFLFAILPSVICYTGVLAGDHLALPPMVMAIFIYARMDKLDSSKFLTTILYFAIIGILVGLASWFRPFGVLLIIAFIISFLIYSARRCKFYKLLAILVVLLVTYSQTSGLAVKISERFFQTQIPSASQRIGEFLLKGLNPESKGLVTLEDDAIANKAYQSFGDDHLGAQAFLIKLAISRLEPNQVKDLFGDKFNLIWASHDALFDYSLAGSNDQELVNLLRSFEALLYLVVTIFIFFHTVISIRQQSNPAIFVMQLFVLGFALLLLLVEVQNRYVIVVIPYSILLGVIGMKDTIPTISMKVRSMLSRF